MIIKHLIEHIIYLHYLVTILMSIAFKIDNRTPVIVPELENIKDMPSRWLKLIELAQKY